MFDYQGFGYSTWEAGKEKGMSDCMVWGRRKELAVEPGVKWMGEAKEIEAPTSARKFLLSKDEIGWYH